jgi:hypothetical protein
MPYVITITKEYRPWWGLGLVRGVSVSHIYPPPYFSYETINSVVRHERARLGETANISIQEV